MPSELRRSRHIRDDTLGLKNVQDGQAWWVRQSWAYAKRRTKANHVPRPIGFMHAFGHQGMQALIVQRFAVSCYRMRAVIYSVVLQRECAGGVPIRRSDGYE